MRADVREALRGRGLSFLGANRERRRLEEYLHEDEIVHDLAACNFGDSGGRALLVASDERVLVIKDGWIFKNSQGMGYQDIRSVEITVGLIFATLQFHGEGMDFEVKRVGRWSAEHVVKLIRARIGSRYNKWERTRQAEADAREALRTGQTNAIPVIPVTTGFIPTQTPTTPPPVVPEVPAATGYDFSSFAAFLETTDPNEVAPRPERLELDDFVKPGSTPRPTRPTRPSLPDTSRSFLDDLERLDALYRNGSLNQAEYETAKSRLLNS
jgi:hypothetical protein